MFSYIDLYAGIGGIRIPFEELGGECVFSSEKDKFARETYFANFKEYPHGDIDLIPLGDIPKHDVLLAGFPCQPFSVGGIREGFSDRQGRGNAFRKIAEIAEYHQPTLILLENVKGLLNNDNGKTFRFIQQTLESLNYTVNYQVLNSKDYGLPQWRERIFIIAIKGQSKPFMYPIGQILNTRAWDIIEKEDNSKYTLSDWHMAKLEEGKRRKYTYQVLDEYTPYTRTLQASYFKCRPEILVSQALGKNPRKLSPRECARLQGFPESFKLHERDRQAWKQLGNSVSVPVVRALARKLIPVIQDVSRSSSSAPSNTNKYVVINYTQLSLF